MKRKYIIGISDPKGHRSNPGLYHPYFGNFLIDCQLLGRFYSLCNALASEDEESIVLEVILSNQKSNYNDWIEMCRIGQNEYKVIGLDDYEGEREPFGSLCNPHIEQTYIEGICGLSNLKYIYLKKTRKVHIKFPTRYFNYIRELC